MTFKKWLKDKAIPALIDGTDSFMAFVMVMLGIVSSQVIKMLNETPTLDWATIAHNMASPRFVIFGLVALMQTGQEEMKGGKDDIAAKAKRANFFSRMERAFSRGFMYTGVGTAG